MPSYTIAHLGCGGRGLAHIEAMLRAQPAVRLVGLCDQYEGNLAKGVALCTQAGQGIRTYADAERMLAAERPDIFSFITQPGTRLPFLDLAIRHAVKAVSYEKPMAASLGDARELVARARAAGIRAVVCHQHKYAGHWRAVKALIESGALGRIREIQAASKGWMLHYASHLIDYAMWLNGGSAPVAVSGAVSGRGKLTDSHPSPDYVLGRLRFANGVHGLIECGTAAPDQDPSLVDDFWMNAGATVIGSDGLAQVLVGRGWRAVTRAHGALGSDEVSFDGVQDTVPYFRELAQWLDDPARPHCCRDEIALIGHETMMAMCASAIEKRELALPLGAPLGYEPLESLSRVLPLEQELLAARS